MGKKTPLMIVLILLTGISVVAVRVESVDDSGIIYIKADGSVDPPMVYINSWDNITYTFIDNVYYSIVLERSNIVIDGDGYTLEGNGSGQGFYLCAISNVTIKNTCIRNFFNGVYLKSTTYNTIFGNTISDNYYGIQLDNSSNNNIFKNSITPGNFAGIMLNKSSNNRISENNIGNNNHGMCLGLAYSNYNIIYGNYMASGWYGIIFSSFSSYNIAYENNIIGNSWYGIDLCASSNNSIYHNNFVDNGQQIDSLDSANVLDNGYPHGGNYWSDYTGVDLFSGLYQNAIGSDGMGDTPFEIDANIDRYPLMGIFSSFNISLGSDVNVISNSTIESFVYHEPSRTITIYVSNKTIEQIFGFCRIMIPHVLISDPYNVIVNGGNPVYWNYTLYDNGTYRWMYFSYKHSPVEIKIIPEISSIIIIPLLIASMLIVRLHKTHKT